MKALCLVLEELSARVHQASTRVECLALALASCVLGRRPYLSAVTGSHGSPTPAAMRSPLFLAKVWGQTGSKLYGAKSGSDYVDNQRRFRVFNEVRSSNSHRVDIR